jgi:hypothetical protein
MISVFNSKALTRIFLKRGFYKKLLFWINCVNVNLSVFPTVFELTKQNEVSVTDGMLETNVAWKILGHNLKYLPEIEREDNTQDWITNSFYTTTTNSLILP